jgi:hypothetical protein
LQSGPIVTDIPGQRARAVEAAGAALMLARAHSTWRAGCRPGTKQLHIAAHADLDTVAIGHHDVDYRVLPLPLYNHDATTYETHIDGRISLFNDLTIS